MKIEIVGSDFSATRGFRILKNGVAINNRNGKMFKKDFDESEIELIIGSSNYLKFENGQCCFDVEAWKINIVSDTKQAKDRQQLLFEIEYIGL